MTSPRDLTSHLLYSLFFFFFSTFIYFWDRERDRAWTGEGQRERGRHRIGNRLQAPSHQPRAWRGARTPGPRDRDLAEVRRLTDCATQAPLYSLFLQTEVLVLLFMICILRIHFLFCSAWFIFSYWVANHTQFGRRHLYYLELPLKDSFLLLMTKHSN